jgi:hypothetical protein
VEGIDGSEMERRAIALYRTQGAALTNLRAGGGGTAEGHKHTDETRAKMRAARRGRDEASARARAERRASDDRRTGLPAAVLDYFRQQGAKGGKIGGKRAAALLSPAERTARAIKASKAAAAARLKKKKKPAA